MAQYNGGFLDAEIVKISSYYLGEVESTDGGIYQWRCPRCKVGTFRADRNAKTAGCTREGCGLYGSVDAVQTIARFEGLDHRTRLREVFRLGTEILDSASEAASRKGPVEGPVGPEAATVPDEPAPASRHGQPETVDSKLSPARNPHAAPGEQRRGPSPEEIRWYWEQWAEQEVSRRIEAEVEKAEQAWWEELKAEERNLIERKDQSVKRVLEAYSWVRPIELLLATVVFCLTFLFLYWLIGVVDGPFLFVLEWIGLSGPQAAAGQGASLWDGLAPFLWEHWRALISTALGAGFSVYTWWEFAKERRRKARLTSKQYVAILKVRRREERDRKRAGES